MYLEFNAWGMSFLPTSGTLQVVVVVHICTFDIIIQQCYTCMELNASIFVSFYCFRSTRRHGFWNQVVKAAFWILNQLFLERFADHQQDPNLLMLLEVPFIILIIFFCYFCCLILYLLKCLYSPRMVKQQAPRSRVQAGTHLAHALLMKNDSILIFSTC